MRRFVVMMLGVALAGAAIAQAPFTIVRPADGSRVREVVKVQVPKNSVPSRGYVGFWVNGKFLEAAIPDPEGDFLVYKLDTKKRQIPDGEMTIEAVLYEDLDTASVIRQRSSVKVTLDNHTSIKVPESGILLRYQFSPGSEYTYGVESRSTVATISQADVARGSRAAELPLDAEKFRFLYAIDNAYKTAKGTDGLVRMQILPKKGFAISPKAGLPGLKYDYALLTFPSGKRRVGYQEMASTYMRVSSTGREVFGGAAPVWPMEGTAGAGTYSHVYAVLPLPVLPEKRVKPGDVWSASIVGGFLEKDIYSMNKFSKGIMARGELLGVEWEGGIPCAKFRTTLSFGEATAQGQELAKAGRDFTDSKIELDQVVWFALDRGVVLKMVYNITQDVKLDQGNQLLRGGNNAAGGAGGPLQPNPRGGPPGGQGDDDMFMGPDAFRQAGPAKGGQAGGQDPRGPRGGAGQGGGFRQGRQGAGNAGGGQQFVRIREQQIYILER